MNKARILLGSFLFVGACDASAQKEPTQDFKNIFQIISSKEALSISFDAHLKKLAPLCSKRDSSDPDYDQKGNVKCVDKSDFQAIFIRGTAQPAVTMIDATIVGAEKCGYMRSLMVQVYGKPAESNGSCNSSWVVKRGKGKPIVHITIEKSTKKDVLYFGNQEEQGL